MLNRMMVAASFCALMLVSVSDAAWTGSFNVGTIKHVSDGRIVFTDAANGYQYQFDGQTNIGKNMLASLLTSKSSNRQVKVNTVSLVLPNWWSINEMEVQN